MPRPFKRIPFDDNDVLDVRPANRALSVDASTQKQYLMRLGFTADELCVIRTNDDWKTDQVVPRCEN